MCSESLLKIVPCDWPSSGARRGGRAERIGDEIGIGREVASRLGDRQIDTVAVGDRAALRDHRFVGQLLIARRLTQRAPADDAEVGGVSSREDEQQEEEPEVVPMRCWTTATSIPWDPPGASGGCRFGGCARRAGGCSRRGGCARRGFTAARRRFAACTPRFAARRTRVRRRRSALFGRARLFGARRCLIRLRFASGGCARGGGCGGGGGRRRRRRRRFRGAR